MATAEAPEPPDLSTQTSFRRPSIRYEGGGRGPSRSISAVFQALVRKLGWTESSSMIFGSFFLWVVVGCALLGTRRAGFCFSFSSLFGNSLPAQLFFKLWRYKGLFGAVFALVPVLHRFLHSFITTSTTYTPRYWFRDLLKSSSCHSSAPQYMCVIQQFVSLSLSATYVFVEYFFTLRGQKVAIMLYDINSFQQPGF